MSDQTAQEPTMEEILASIRRIISEDDAPPPAAEAQAEPEPLPEPEPPVVMTPAPPEEDEDILELTETVDADTQTIGDLDVYTKEAPEPVEEIEPEPESTWAPDPEPAPEPVFTSAPVSNIPVHGEMTVVELVKVLLEPKLGQWADENLEAVVDRAVREILTEKLGRVFR